MRETERRRQQGEARWRAGFGLICARAALLGGVLALSLLSPLAAVAQELSLLDTRTPAFFIESITVENARRFSPDIIVAESHLEPGRAYSERELRDAAARVVRLPLVLDARLSLRKGSERDRYELVIGIIESRLWFFGLDLRETGWSRPLSIAALDTTHRTEASSGVVGRRFGVGAQGVAYVAAGGDDGTIQAGFRRFDLFDRNAVFGVSYGFSDCGSERKESDPEQELGDGCRTEIFDLGLDPTLSTWSIDSTSQRARFDLAVPLQGNRSVRLSASYRWTESGIRRQAFDPKQDRVFLFDDRRELEVGLAWVSESIDDPVFPTEGRSLEAGLALHFLAADLRDRDLSQRTVSPPFPMEGWEAGARLASARHWPITHEQSLFVGGSAFLGRSRLDGVPTEDRRLLSDDLTSWRLSLAGGHGRFLRRMRSEERWRELRWESTIEGFWSGTSPDFAQRDNPMAGLRAGTGLTLRTGWCVLRLRVEYVYTGGR